VLAPEPVRVSARHAALTDLARFIAACYYEPETVFVEAGLFDSMSEAASHVDAELEALARRLGPAFEHQPLQELLVDYTRLFLGPVQALAQPYASVWLSGQNQLMQAPTLDVMALYDQAGFEVDGDFQELPDHVAVELEFLYLLLWRENEARATGDAAALDVIASTKRDFLDQHLGRWLGPFVLAMHDGAQTEFYETLAQLTERFVRLSATESPQPAALATD
jgi:putative dimethyl sulfoxide reductase chaperone